VYTLDDPKLAEEIEKAGLKSYIDSEQSANAAEWPKDRLVFLTDDNVYSIL